MKRHKKQSRVRELTTFAVRPRPGRRDQGIITIGGRAIPCALGRSGIRALKREGDGATPLGRWKLERVLFRSDRGPRPRSRLRACPIRKSDGWCDAPQDRNYNRPVHLPYPASCEALWRDDILYNIVITLNHNQRPRVRGRGSAIFAHIARPDMSATEGCIAMRTHDLQFILQQCGSRAVFAVLG